MSATSDLHDLGQSLWLDNITRDMLDDGTLAAHIAERNVTGLTSNPTIFEHAVSAGDAYDASIRASIEAGRDGEGAFFDLALDDITRAADLFRPIHDKTDGVDGFVSLEVSPLLARDSAETIRWAKDLHARGRPPQPLHQDSRHARGPARDRRGDLRRHPDQRHAAVRHASSTWRRPTPT